MSERLLSMFTQTVVTTFVHHLFQVTSFSRYFAAVTPQIVVSPGQDVGNVIRGIPKNGWGSIVWKILSING